MVNNKNIKHFALTEQRAEKVFCRKLRKIKSFYRSKGLKDSPMELLWGKERSGKKTSYILIYFLLNII